MLFFSKNDNFIYQIRIIFSSVIFSAIIFGTVGFHIYAYAEENEKLSFPFIWNLSNANEYFTGRKDVLKDIHDSFQDGHHLIHLVGGTGMGKTQIAKKFAEIDKENYDIVWWIDSDKNKNIDEQFKKLAIEWNNIYAVHAGNHINSNQDQKIGRDWNQDRDQDLKINIFLPTEEIVKQLKERLRTTQLNWLLIFDSAAGNERVKDYLPEKHNHVGYSHILVTSVNPFSWSNVMELKKFTRDESIELLIKITNKADREDMEDRIEAGNLAEALKDFPLALVQAATYIKSHPSIPMREYQELFLSKRENLWKAENKVKEKDAAFDNYKFTVFTTLSLIIKEIEKESPEAVKLLAFCSFLNHKNVPKALLIAHLSNITKMDSFDREDAISILQKYSLIQLHEIKGNYDIEHLSTDIAKGLNATFTIHEITQLAVQDYLGAKERKSSLEKSINSLAEFLPDKLDIFIPLADQANFLPVHMQTIAGNAEKQGIYNNDLVILYIRELEHFLTGKRDFIKSKQLIEKIEEILPKISKDKLDNLALCRFHLMMAVFFAWRDTDYTNALKETHEAIRLLEKLEGIHDEEYLMSYNRLIQLYVNLGDKENTLKYAKLGEELLNKSTEFIGNQDAFFYSLAQIYIDDEQLEKAIYYSKKAIGLISKRIGGIMVGDFPIYLLEIEILIRKNQFKESYKKLDKIFKIAKNRLQNSDNAYMGHIMILYGYSSFLVNGQTKTNYITEKNIILSGQDMLRRVFEDKYNKKRNAALSHIFMGEILEKEGDNLKAHTEYSIAWQIFNNVNSSKQIVSSDTGDLYAKLAIINVKLNEPITAQEYLTILQENFGYKHSKTIKVRDYFIDHGVEVGY